MQATEFKNEYWLLRHGRSLANEAETIVSKPENGIDDRWTLAPVGEDQARAAGLKFRQALQAAERSSRQVLVYASPFSRTQRTAFLAAEAAGLQSEICPVQVAPELRERFFGDKLELQPYNTAYGKIWERDEVSSTNVPGGNGESVDEVSSRIRQLFQQRLEAEHQGAIIMLVSHGDTLSILQATMLGEDPRLHRRFAFETAELRPLLQAGPGRTKTMLMTPHTVYLLCLTF
ncbi:phosphoglycerate mutase [Volvox carteri f. nagariensis]|uniref:Phosphoglycerate mutase n=1 Tax=Volvox carteri f. nagariensis TaxID=3068 RepID=D8TMB2_VOLCA|nr:phosphoglycerate mutase [Volvox carteri f. nagariensis]EFJ51472.1 phosphoglycerate mutase [Volvox carteri f. nagariensis]|eukprot:XP_002947424.1 phosphoglycerate mutase [Volvox carteri f. nagariensis]